MNIGPKTIEKMKAMAAEQIDTYTGQINAAFLKADDGKLKVSLSFDIAVSTTKEGGIDLDATIYFTESKVKEKISDIVFENQEELPLAGIYIARNPRRRMENWERSKPLDETTGTPTNNPDHTWVVPESMLKDRVGTPAEQIGQEPAKVE